MNVTLLLILLPIKLMSQFIDEYSLIDFDANLLHEDLVNIKNELIDTAKANGVKAFVVPGSTLDDSEATR